MKLCEDCGYACKHGEAGTCCECCEKKYPLGGPSFACGTCIRRMRAKVEAKMAKLKTRMGELKNRSEDRIVPSFGEFFVAIERLAKDDASTTYGLRLHSSENNYFGVQLDMIQFQGNLWKALLQWGKHLHEKTGIVMFLKGQYEITANNDEWKEWDPKDNNIPGDFPTFDLPDGDMGIFLGCTIETLIMNDTLWLTHTKK